MIPFLSKTLLGVLGALRIIRDLMSYRSREHNLRNPFDLVRGTIYM